MRCFGLVCVLIGSISCSSSDNPSLRGDGGANGKQDGGGGDGAVTGTLSFVTQTVDADRAGEFTAIGSVAGRIGLAYFRQVAEPDWPTVQCPATALGGGGAKARPAHDLLYVESTDGGVNWSTPPSSPIEQTIGSAFGVSIAMSGATTHIAYLGGALSQVECASSDAVLATSGNGTTWSTRMLFAAGDVGDTVGYWNSVAIDGSGQPQTAFRDVRFGLYEQTGNTKSFLRFTSGELIADNGAGTYADLEYDTQGRPVVLHYNPHQINQQGGLQLAIREGSNWMTQQLVPGSTTERPSLNTDGQGKFGVAYQDTSLRSLKYIESTDLSTWTTPQTVEISTYQQGRYSALAYDSRGNPAISYYRCDRASAGGSQTSCNPREDGLMFAYRRNGLWETQLVDDGGSNTCGDQTSLTFNDQDEPVIAYRCVALRNSDNAFVETLKVARGFVRQ